MIPHTLFVVGDTYVLITSQVFGISEPNTGTVAHENLVLTAGTKDESSK